jgi:hypothetical protein
MIRPVLAFALALGAAMASGQAWAARSYGNCNGYIDSLPATVDSSGTWCLRANELTAQESGAAITVSANYVVIDCNDFRLSGFAAGASTRATGIAVRREFHNVTVRNCQVGGFRIGVEVLGFNHVVEGNRIDSNTYIGIFGRGGFNIARDNLVRDTGGRPAASEAFGIMMLGDFATVLDNIVAGVSADSVVVTPFIAGQKQRVSHAYGIVIGDGLVQANRVLDVDETAVGIQVLGDGAVLDNVLFHGGGKSAVGIDGGGGRCDDNVVIGYKHRHSHCVGGPET